MRYTAFHQDEIGNVGSKRESCESEVEHVTSIGNKSLSVQIIHNFVVDRISHHHKYHQMAQVYWIN